MHVVIYFKLVMTPLLIVNSFDFGVSVPEPKMVRSLSFRTLLKWCWLRLSFVSLTSYCVLGELRVFILRLFVSVCPLFGSFSADIFHYCLDKNTAHDEIKTKLIQSPTPSSYSLYINPRKLLVQLLPLYTSNLHIQFTYQFVLVILLLPITIPQAAPTMR